MTADQVNTHLQSVKCTDVVGEIADDMPTSNMMEMANYLRWKYQSINKAHLHASTLW